MFILLYAIIENNAFKILLLFIYYFVIFECFRYSINASTINIYAKAQLYDVQVDITVTVSGVQAGENSTTTRVADLQLTISEGLFGI
jgi:hypothetical protein